MAYRGLFFLLLLVACAPDQPSPEPVNSALATIVREPLLPDFDPTICREITTPTGRFLTGGATAVVQTILARSQVQCEVDVQAGFSSVSLKIIPKPGVLLTNDTLLQLLLEELDARLVPLDSKSSQLHLRAAAIREDIILATSDYTGAFDEATALDSLAAHGIHLTNDTGIPLTVDPETLDFYLPSLHLFFGDTIGRTRFWLEAVPVRHVKLVKR